MTLQEYIDWKGITPAYLKKHEAEVIRAHKRLEESIENVVGIDPGADTCGFAWKAKGYGSGFGDVCTGNLISMCFLLNDFSPSMTVVYFEDARLRSGSTVKKQGAGYAKGYCKAIEGFLKEKGYPYVRVKPKAGMTKWPEATWRKATGYQGETDEHGRDAALLILNR